LDAARAVRAGLLSTGQLVNRRTLGDGLRAAGYGVRNDKLGALLRSLASDSPNGARPAGLASEDGGDDRG
jgi:hypothetical protein